MTSLKDACLKRKTELLMKLIYLHKIRIYLKELQQEYDEGYKSDFKEMEDISKETYIGNKNILCLRIKHRN